MFKSIPLTTNQKDIIHDISFDYYGKRMATGSGDHSINVWDINEKGEWFFSSSWKAHNGPVWKVIWAHPEYGQVLASCSFDRTVIIWEEMPHTIKSNKPSTCWIKRTSLVDARASVTSIAFAPHSSTLSSVFSMMDGVGKNKNNRGRPSQQPINDLGLQLVAASADGIVRFYEAPDVANLNQWSLMDEMSISVASGGSNGGGFEFKVGDGEKWVPSYGDTTSSKAIKNNVIPSTTTTTLGISLSWSTSRLFSPLLAFGIDGSQDTHYKHKGRIQIYQSSENGKNWILIDDQLGSVTEPVKDIKFAPDVGLSYHVLAVATQSNAYIFALKPGDSSSINTINNESSSLTLTYKSFLDTYAKPLPTPMAEYSLYQMAQLSAPNHVIWRLSWNITGSVLATSGQDGIVRLWKADFLGQWKCTVALKNDGMVVNGNIPTSANYRVDPQLPKQSEPSSYKTRESDPNKNRSTSGKVQPIPNIDSPTQVVWH